MTVILSNGKPAAIASKSYPFTSLTTTTTGPSAGLVPLLRGESAASYEFIFRTQPILHAAIMKQVYGIARNPLKVYQYGLDGESRERVRSHPAAQLIKRPAPGVSEFSFKAALALDLHIHGEALAVKQRERGAGSSPTELWHVPWRWVGKVEDDHGNVLGFVVTVDGRTMPVGPEEVVHIALPGGSPLAPLRRTLALEEAAQTYAGENMRNGMSPRAAFLSETRLPDGVIPRIREELRKLYGGVDNAGSVAIIDNGLKPERIGMSPIDMALVEQRKLSRDEVCAVLDIPPTLLGLERGTYASVSEYRRALYDSIATKLVLIEESLQAQLIEPQFEWDGVFVEFDTGELLRPDPEARARMHMLMQQSGVNSINERRRVENLPPIEDPTADAVLAPTNMQVVGDSRDELASMTLRERIDAVGILIRSGFDPLDAARTVGLPPMDYLPVRPVTIQPLTLDAQQLDAPSDDSPDAPSDQVLPDAGTPAQSLADQVIADAINPAGGQ